LDVSQVAWIGKGSDMCVRTGRSWVSGFCLIAVTVVFGFATSSRAADRRVDKSVLTVMTLNAEFLWDGAEPEEGRVDFPWKHSETEAAEHMEQIAQIIRRANADIVHLVEVENELAAGALNDNHLQGLGYRVYFIKGRDSYTGQDVALLTRIDPESDRIERDDTTGQSGDVVKGVSKNLYAKFTVGTTKIAIVGLHLLAQPNRQDRARQREAQADVIRRRIAVLQSEGYLVIVLGDFNDYDGETACRDHIDSLPVTNVLRIIRGLVTAATEDDLFNVTEFVPKANRYTAYWDQNDNGQIEAEREYTSIDHILMSAGLRPRVRYVDIPHSHDPRSTTDHFPVVARLGLGDSSASAALQIARLLPNPEGNESDNEEATIRNLSQQAVDLTGWTLRDLVHTNWSLSSLGTLLPGQEKTIRRQRQRMALNNDGDTIELCRPDGTVTDTITYGPVEEGEMIVRGD
jgi:exonuclease III